MNETREDVVGDFAGFSDRPESPFYCSDGISAVETWDRSVDSMASVLLELSDVVQEPDFRFTPDLLCDWHRRIFGSLFPDEAGGLRWRKEGEWEHVYFGGNVGTVRSRRTKEYRGVHPQKLRNRVEGICDEFNEARAELIDAAPGSVSINDATYAVARLYAKLLRAHPWADGNLRVTFVALHAALLSLDLPRVMFPDLELHDDLIGVAFRNDNEPYLQLANYLADYICDELAD
jgi:fido (protein-threonine AMPylation protein)